MSVKGMADILPEESWKWEKIRSLFLENARRFGYKLIETPIVEHADLFIRGIGDGTDIVDKQMYLFNDKKGKHLALRPEGTASAVRSFVEHKYNSELLHKWCYFGPMYRYERPQKGRMRQFHQAGIEAFGVDDPALDAEQIILARELLVGSFGIESVKILLNSIGCPACRPGWQVALVDYFRRYDRELCDNCRRRLDINPLRILDCKVQRCSEIAKDAPAGRNYLCGSCSAHHNKLKQYLSDMNIVFEDDPMLVRGLDYYTKTVFEITTDKLGSQSALIAGGRYNDLVKSLGGKDSPATGWAMGIERIFLLSDIKNASEKTVYFIALDEPSKIVLFKLFASAAKRRNCRFDYKGGSLKSQLRRANGAGAQICAIMGENERIADTLLIKDMKNKTQKLIKIDEFGETL